VAQSRRNLVVVCGAFGQGSFLKNFENMQVENIEINYERLKFAHSTDFSARIKLSD